jgi:hypothetical protein
MHSGWSLLLGLAALYSWSLSSSSLAHAAQPNFVIIMTDDQVLQDLPAAWLSVISRLPCSCHPE